MSELLTHQDGVIARPQFLAAVGAPYDLQRLVRRRELTRLLPGVFVNHSGLPTWQQRAIGGVMLAGRISRDLRMTGAALGGHSALRAALGHQWRHGGGESAPIIVCISDRRSHQPVPGYRFVRRARLSDVADQLVTPPRLRPEEAVLDVVGGLADPVDGVGILADLCQSRRVSSAQVLSALEGRAKFSGRRRLGRVLADLAAGTSSALEYEFIERVVRAHGLPVPTRQSSRVIPAGGRSRREFRECEWPQFTLVAELDGRAFHDNAGQRDRDLDRDLDDQVAGKQAIRLGWGQVTARACDTAHKLGVILRARGWDGPVHRCQECSRALVMHQVHHSHA